MLQKLLQKKQFRKKAQATGDSIGNKIAHKITSLGKTKSKEEEDEKQEIYIPPEKRQLIIDGFRFFQTPYITELPKSYEPVRYNI